MLAVMLLTCATSFAERTWLRPAVQSIQTEGAEQYFYNVEYGGFLCGANDWGTRASVARDKGLKISVTQVGMSFKLGQMSPDNADGVWVDGNRDGNDKFGFVLLENDRFNIINEKFPETYLTWTGDEGNTRLNFTESPANGTWYSVSVEEFNRYIEEDLEKVMLYLAALPLKDLLDKANELGIDDSSERAVYNNDDATIEQLNDAIASLTAKVNEAQGIYTHRIVNNTVTGATGWTCERPVGGNGPMLNGTAFEYWGGNATSRQDAGFNYYQKIAGLPAGKYVLGVAMYNASNGEGEGHEPNGNAGLYLANGETESFVGVTEDGEELLPYTTQEVAVNEGDEITVGVKSIGYMSARWFVADNFTLVRTGDLPSTELVNGDFSEGVVGDVNIATYAKDGEVNQMQPVPGWEFGVANGDARAAGVVAYGSGTTLGGSTYTVPAAGPEGTNGNALGLVGVWTGTVKYVQDVTLPAGKYTMTVPVYNTAGTNAFVKNLIGVKYGETEVLAPATSYPVGKWTDETVVFELAEETNVTVSLGYEGANVGSGAAQHLFYDCVKIETYDELAVAKAAALAALPVADASIFTPNTEDVEAVKAAIEAATTVAEVEAAAATELTIPALSGEWTIYNATANNYLGYEEAQPKLVADAAVATFAKVDGGFSIKVGDAYINMKGGNTWSMSADAEAKTAWNFTLTDGKYTIKGPNGLIGTDGTEAGEFLFGNKNASQNGLWVIEEYVDPNAKEVVLLYTLDTTLEENKGTDNGYATACDVTVDGVTWNVTGNATMAPWRLGGKSLENVDRVVKTTTAYAGDVQKVVLTLGDVVSGITVNSVTLAYADNAEFTDAKTIVKDHATSLEFAPEGGFGANMFYQFAVNVTVPGTSNKYVTFNKVEFYGYAPEEETSWDGKTVVTSLDETTVTKLSDLDGMTITLPGAKSIEMIDVEEIAYLALQNQDGSQLYGIWSPSYGGTCSIDGETITLSGFVTLEEVTTEIPAGTTKLYIEDYGTFIVDGVQDVRYIPTIELTANISGAAEPFTIVVSNNDVEGTAEGVEASEDGVYYQFEVLAQGKALSKGEGAPTLSLMEDATVDFGAADLVAYEVESAYIRFMTLQEPYFTMPGTYVLTIPEGTFVDAEGTPNAETTVKWVIVQQQDPVLADGDYVILNVESGKYLNGSNDWGTKASVTEHGQFMTVTLNDGKYSINSHYSNGGGKDYLAAGDNTYLDAAVVYHEIEEVEGGYTIKDVNGKYLVSDGNVANFNGDEPQVWQFISKEDLIASMADATAEAPVDATALVPDADFSRNNADFNKWEGESKMTKGGPNNAKDATARGMNAEKWGGNSTSIDFHTTLTDLPNGKYTVKFQGLYRYNNTTANTNDVAEAAHADGTEKIHANFSANDEVVPFLSIFDEASVELYGKAPFSQAEASEAFTLGAYQTELEVEVTDGTLTLKVEKLEADHEGCDWTILDNIQLYYMGAEVDPKVVQATAKVGETEPDQYGDQFYTVTMTVAAEEIAGLGVAHAFCEGIQLTDGETTCTFVATAVDGIDVAEGEDVVFTCKDVIPSYTSDAEYEGDFRKEGTYQGTCTIVLTDADYNEIGAAVFEGEVILPTPTGINDVKFNVTNVVYTINGVRVQKPVKGVNIINGKKVVIK